ncbi:MAG: hypothetical protein AB1728_07935 [Bacteroidota bacterium]
MHNLSQKIIGAEHLTEVIAFLKNADKNVREGNIQLALDEIMHAREKNPTIMYARAYEEYVRSILLKVRQQNDSGPLTQESLSPIINEFLPTLDKILELAIKEVKRSAVTAYKQKEMLALRKRREEEAQREEDLRIAGISNKITMYINRARSLQEKKDFHNALNEVARAFMLDPTDERIQQLEEEIKQQQEEYKKEEQLENERYQQSEQKRRQFLFEEWQFQRQKEKELQKKQEEEAYKQARAQKIREYLQVARSLFAERKLEEAMSQLAFVLVLDPLNEEVLGLNWQIREEQTQRNNVQLAQRQQQLEQENKKKAAIREGIRKHLLRAEKCLGEKKFSDALRIITQAYFIDPTSEDVAAVERKILAAEEEESHRQEEERKRIEDERRRKQESELHRLAIEQQKRDQLKEKIDLEAKQLKEQEEVLLCLSKARGYVSQGKYDEALSQVAQAFKINPFDEEITKLQQEIIEAKRKGKYASKLVQELALENDQQHDEEKHSAIEQCILSAQRLQQQHMYKEALDEIAQGYRHDPLNEELFALEGEIQQEFLKYEERQRIEKEANERSMAIKKSLATARECISRESYGEALAWVDYALSFDMQRYETLQLKDEIERAQRQIDERKSNEDKELVIQVHLSRAMEYLAEKRISEATLEVDLALRLNPSHQGAINLRARLRDHSGESVLQKV